MSHQTFLPKTLHLRFSGSAQALFLGVALLLLGGCATSSDPGGPAVLAVRVLTEGVEVDVDGYNIDASDAVWSVAANDSLIIDALPEGDYLVRLSDLAGNCATVDSIDSHAIQLSNGTTTLVQFNVLCATTAPPDTSNAPNSNAPACYLNGTECSDAELNAWAAAEEARIAIELTASQPVYDSLRAVWDKYLNYFPQGQSEFLICKPKSYKGEVHIVGPEGADIRIGRLRLRIPSGALTKRTVITGEVPASLLVDAELSPHGLQFAPGVTVTLNYRHCDRPEEFEYRVAYIDANRNVLEWPISTDFKREGKVRAEIDHFSKYAVAY